MRLTHIRLLVTRFDACFEFYHDQLGLEVVFGQPGEPYAEFRAGDALIAINVRDMLADLLGTAALPVDAHAQDRVAVILAADDVDATYTTLRGRGVAFLNEPHDQPGWGVRVVHLRDPDGNLIEINQSIPMAE